MKYLSIDIETTGLDPVEHKIIEFGCLIEDTTKPHIPVSELPHYGMHHSSIVRWQPRSPCNEQRNI